MKFYKEIENYFLEARGKLFGLSSYNLLSPKEIQAIKKMENSGISITVIKEAIDVSLKKFLNNYPTRRDDPPSLLYCQPVIFKMWKEYRNSTIGGKNESGISNDDSKRMLSILRNNLDILEKSKSELFKVVDKERWQIVSEAIKSAIECLKTKIEMISAGEENTVSIEDTIEKIRSELIYNIRKSVSFGTIKKIMKETKNEIREYKMQKSVYRETRNIIIDDKLLDLAGLSKFGLQK